MDNWNWDIRNLDYWQRTVERCRQRRLVLPTFQQLKSPHTIPAQIQKQLAAIGMDELHPLNLFRINWCNDPIGGGIGEINYLEIPSKLTGVEARIVGLVGKHFPTGAHKVGATYGCLVPYLVSGRFDPDYHKAVWPSTGNYCRGGVFNSNLLSVHSVAILPEQMSQERFDWLRQMGAEVFATPGCESNVKEIYDKCHELEATSDQYFIFNQFEQFGNAVWHYEVSGSTIERLFEQIKNRDDQVRGFVSATGSAGTIAAGDYLRKKFPWIKVLAAEALQCPTLYLNGFGGHRIEGIGDKHIPWIHNIKNLDLVCAIDDEQPLRLLRLFNDPAGWEFLRTLGVTESLLSQLPLLGISSLCNLLSAIKLAKYFEWGPHDVIFTIFTDSVELYRSRLREMDVTYGPYTIQQAAIDWHVSMKNQGIDFIEELSYYGKKSIHNLKYFTWVEQQGKDVDELNAQWIDESYWEQRLTSAPVWDRLIERFNQAVGLT
ncbi:MAG: pyridoxal-phosphate dependent enzyme [candidate division KSB1 bacterium]|nr:pyridoxal-phosphate dependent enzyme [candidate division KSB1 bacterium]MDZ7317672.1 pyridoxal-phosphate dependent enzyme [candidate division KSB1 bacterium]MDZ7341534.1 pyridoxal-phosphate dependent enzyme [candidate division KSB1 bacterium]